MARRVKPLLSEVLAKFAVQTTAQAKAMSNAPRKALQAAALLGDRTAIEELKCMSENRMWAFIIAVIISGGVAGGYFGWQGCVANTQAQEVRLTAEAKAKADLETARLKAAQDLRVIFVQRCTLTPDQAEAVVPPK